MNAYRYGLVGLFIGVLSVQVVQACPLSDGFERSSVIEALDDPRIMQINANMVVDTADDLLTIVDRARACGANTVMFSDAKVHSWAIDDAFQGGWFTQMQQFYDGVKARDMAFIFRTGTVGFAGSLIASNPNLATAYPIIDQAMVVQGGALVPQNSAAVINGGFEQFDGDVALNWTLQDEPGVATFIDTQVSRSGSASLRAVSGQSLARVRTNITVQPWHQYTLRVWLRTEALSGRSLVIVRDAVDHSNLTNQLLSTPKDDGGRRYFNNVSNFDLEWTEMRLSFNSQDSTDIEVWLGLYSATEGMVWWDDLSITDTPILNWVNRDDLPISARREDDTVVSIPDQLARPVDPLLGEIVYPGQFANYHNAPSVPINDTANFAEGETIRLSGWHTQVTASGQIGASWHHPDVLQRLRTTFSRLDETFDPEGYLFNTTEVRTGGHEPLDQLFANSGEAFAANVQQVLDDIQDVSPGKIIYVWSDMFDPIHNARDDYYQVANTLAGAWEGLDPNRVRVINWWEGQRIVDLGPDSLSFFADRGFKQVLGAYYDADVLENYTQWQQAAEGVENIIGSVYATWREDYTQIESFGELWW